jgi:hypothetical protein
VAVIVERDLRYGGEPGRYLCIGEVPVDDGPGTDVCGVLVEGSSYRGVNAHCPASASALPFVIAGTTTSCK